MVDLLNGLFEELGAASAENELVALSTKLPLWQKDALRRIAQQGCLSDEDKETLKSAMYAEQGLETFTGKLTPLSSDHCQVDPNTAPRALLCSIGPVEHINRLASGQPPLQFAPNGITLIYGDNGSGKSGYIRIGKKICRARTDGDLLGDAYSDVSGTPKADIRWLVEGDEEIRKLAWNPDQPPPPELSSISVFDTHHAALYVDGQRQMTFLPFEVELYTQLVNVVSEFEKEVKSEIDSTRNALAALPELTEGTKAYNLALAVTNAASEDDLPSEEELTKFAKWEEDDEKALVEARRLAAHSPLAQANLRSRCAATLTKIASEVQVLETALSDARAKELQEKYLALIAAKEANDLAAQGSFSDLPLGHVGSETWQNLFRHAREYSVLAYPDETFPYTGEDAKCVLCHHPLSDDAKQRFTRFDNFISGKAAKDFEAKTTERVNTVKALNKLTVPTADNIKERLAEYTALNEEREQIVDALATFLTVVEARRDAFILAAMSGNFDNIGDAQTFSPTLHAEVAALKAEEGQFRKDAEGDDQQTKHAIQLAELEGHKVLAQNATNLKNNRAQRIKLLRLEACAKSIATRAISLSISKLRKKHLTSDLTVKIKAEIDRLGLSYLNVSVRDETDKGTSNFMSDLGFKKTIKNNSHVLSEGEQRGLALACFLAEANMRPIKHGLIVDDPVSSLDHQRIERVAMRLVEEAEHGRQVIVFTHNALFYQEVVNQAGEMQVPLAKNVIYRNIANGAGLVEADVVPAQLRKVTERIDAVRNELASWKKDAKAESGDEYRKFVEDVCTSLRKAWERLVEEVLLNKTVQRFSYGVQTQSLKGVLVDGPDYGQIYHAMKKLSNFSAHDEAGGKQSEPPTIEKLLEALNELDSYRDTINKRRIALEKERKDLEIPPKADFA